MKGLTQTQINANRKAVVKKLNDAGYSIPPLLDLDTFLRNIKEENHRISIFFRSQNY